MNVKKSKKKRTINILITKSEKELLVGIFDIKRKREFHFNIVLIQIFERQYNTI